MVRTLAERLRMHEQSKTRLAEAEAKLKLDEHRQRTRRLVEAGTLIDKAGLLDLDSNALYGALLSLRDGADNQAQIEKWAALGGRAFARDTTARDEGKEPVLLTFAVPLAKDTTTNLTKDVPIFGGAQGFMANQACSALAFAVPARLELAAVRFEAGCSIR